MNNIHRREVPIPGVGVLEQRSIWGRGAEMGLKISGISHVQYICHFDHFDFTWVFFNLVYVCCVQMYVL